MTLPAAARPELMVGALFAIIGFVLLSAAIYIGVATRNFIRNAAVAQGSVIDVLAAGSHPKVQFVTPSGQSITFPQGGWTFGYHAGERVRILYDAGDPAGDARVDSFGSLWFTPLLLGALGVAFLIAAVANASAAGAFTVH
jgi:hypothetical protein